MLKGMAQGERTFKGVECPLQLKGMDGVCARGKGDGQVLRETGVYRDRGGNTS